MATMAAKSRSLDGGFAIREYVGGEGGTGSERAGYMHCLLGASGERARVSDARAATDGQDSSFGFGLGICRSSARALVWEPQRVSSWHRVDSPSLRPLFTYVLCSFPSAFHHRTSPRPPLDRYTALQPSEPAARTRVQPAPSVPSPYVPFPYCQRGRGSAAPALSVHLFPPQTSLPSRKERVLAFSTRKFCNSTPRC